MTRICGWAKKKLGKVLKQTPKAKGAAKKGVRRTGLRGSVWEQRNDAPTLADLGIDRKTSSEAQRLDDIPDSDYLAALDAAEKTTGKVNVDEIDRDLLLQRKQKAAADLPPVKLPAGQFDLILADPPWQYDFERVPEWKNELHYPTLPASKIAALKVPAAKNCVLFLWATAPKLREALEVMAGWGFTYKTHAIWDKQWTGMGYWFRSQHELLLVGTKGKISPPATSHRVPSLFSFRRGRHSAKPQEVYKMFEAMMPRTTKCELFARAARPGWTAWGNQVRPHRG